MLGVWPDISNMCHVCIIPLLWKKIQEAAIPIIRLCVHQTVFSQLKMSGALLKMPEGLFGGAVLFQLRRFGCYDMEYLRKYCY